MRLLMISGDRQVAIGETGPFHALQREFSRHFERIDVICPRPSKAPTVKVIHDNVHLHPAGVARSGMMKYVFEKGRELLAEHGATLITSHDYGWFYNGMGAARLSKETGVPYVSELHHVPGHPVAADMRERFDKRIARAYVRYALSRALAFRVVNRVEMPSLLRSWGVPDEKILVLPSLYIDLDVFRVADPRPAPRYDVCFVGRMVNNKGLSRIVDALALLAREQKGHSAIFIGKGPLLGATRKRVERRGLGASTHFIEWVASPAELAEIYRSSRVVVCASTCEGGPRFTVEAMACGTPVVSTRVGVMSELLRSGENGELVDFDTADLARGLGKVLADETQRARLGLRAARDAQRFEYKRTIQQYAEGLKALVTPTKVRGKAAGEA
ncbi:MAG: glycosyltransferase family 4 protein [Planctomycetes bacterium]|nr:glycosyltransferase family 4 protein [Planctomycetota bacterium]